MGLKLPQLTAAAVFLVGILALWFAGGPERPQNPPQERPPEILRAPKPEIPKDLGGSDRVVAHLSTDKPVYRPGERVHARAVLLDAFSRKPAAQSIFTSFEVRSARGELVSQVQSSSESSVAPFGWEIPEGLAGGSYTLVAKFPHHGYADAEAAFDVRSYRVPRLRTDLQFLKKAFGPGDEVTALLSATRAEGGIPSGARVTAVATVDGAEVHRAPLALDVKGGLSVTFRLPGEIAVGNGTLALVIEDGGVHETAAKSIPIVVNRVMLSFFPEGGDLVGGVAGRVYFEARTPKQEPADVSGRILDESGRQVASFESVHEGRGRFAFTPLARGHYRAVIDKPSGIKDPIALPQVREGFALAAVEDVTPAASSVRVRVASPVATAVMVGLFLREKELARRIVRLEAGVNLDISLVPKDKVDGVLRVTVFDGDGTPRAERLVFRAPDKNLRVGFTIVPARTVPGGKVSVKVRTTDADGRPVPSVVGLSAVDDSVLETIDKRERAPRLPVQALLGAEVKELKDPAAYLSNDPQAPFRMDLLLATQGWRRFAFLEPSTFVAQYDAAGRRALALRQAPAPVLEADLLFADAAGENFDAERRLGARFKADFKPQPNRVPQPEPKPRPAPPPPPMIVRDPVPAPEPPPAVPMPARPPLEQPARARELNAGLVMIEELRMAKVPPPEWGRVYAHTLSPNRPQGQRTDFTETVYWNAGLATDAVGEATFTFNVSDAITTFRLRADGFTKDGAFGEADGSVEVRRPFYVEPKFPLEVTAGDRIDLPVSIVNGTEGALTVQIDTTVGKGLRLVEGGAWKSPLAGGSSIRTLLPIAVDPLAGEVELRLRAQAAPHEDDVTRKIRVVPSGFPIESNFGGLLERIVRHEIAIPDVVEPGSLSTHIGIYPSPLASLTQALAALLQEPGGCFEQTSSSNYPNIMALQYLKGHSGVDPDLVRRASELAERGYRKLVAFECRNKGYEWFGSDPGHEALTAYGVMEFLDMSRVMNVDMTMIERTREWLLSRRDGKGGFLRDPKALDSFGGAPQDITDAYILWAMTEAGQKGLEKEIQSLKEGAQRSEDPYFLSLAALVLQNTGDRASAESLLARLASKQDKTGAIPGARTSITRSGGESLEVETASLAILGWLRSPKHTANSEKAMRWLLERCKGGRFGATQSTILALKAIVAYDAAHARPKRAGEVTLEVDGRVVQVVAFPAGQEGPIILGDFSASLTPGKHVLELRMKDGADMPYSLQVRYHARTPAASDKCKVALRTALAKAQVTEGEAVDVTVEVLNRSKDGLPMVTAIVGLPGGLEVRAEQLKELVREGKADAFETRGREVILYWRAMAPGAKHALVLSCVAAVPGEYSGPASRAYLYYTDEHKDWQPGLRVRIPRR